MYNFCIVFFFILNISMERSYNPLTHSGYTTDYDQFE